MTDVATPWPLRWPHGRPRRAAGARRRGRFNRKEDTAQGFSVSKKLSVGYAFDRLQEEIDAIGGRYAVVSTNLEVRLNGLPRGGQREPADPGVAVYFQLGGKPLCLPCDTYERVADNIAAVAAHINATRAITRHGVSSVAEMFSGFQALPSPDDRRPWRQVLELHRAGQVTADDVRAAYVRLARERHPDAGGSDAMMAETNRARDEAMREIGNV